MNFKQEDIAAIETLGYTPDEARFLYLVAVHSGYFIPRQFLVFSGTKWGKRSNGFINKLESRGHASWREYDRIGGVYHLFSKTLYRYIGKENLRNRRRHSIEFIRTRILLLDFILANMDFEYFETESEKVAYFCQELGLPRIALPAKTYEGGGRSEPTLRYFVDKFPLFVDKTAARTAPTTRAATEAASPAPLHAPATSSATSSPTLPSSQSSMLPASDSARVRNLVTFSYVDPGQATLAGFAHHLHAYLPLLRKLDQFTFTYISNSVIHFLSAERCFEAVVHSPLKADVSSQILRYFELRHAWEGKRYGSLCASDIEWLKEASHRFHGQRFEESYGAWAAGTLNQNALRIELAQTSSRRAVSFRTYLVESTRIGRNRLSG